MVDVEKYAQELKETFDTVKALSKKLAGTSDWEIDQVTESFQSMFERFCPFQVGQRVELIKSLDIDPNSGWHHSRHYLVRASPGVVAERGYYKGEFVFQVKFDLESWISRDWATKVDTVKPVLGRHTHNLGRHTHNLREHSLCTTSKAKALFGIDEQPEWFADIAEYACDRYGYTWDWILKSENGTEPTS